MSRNVDTVGSRSRRELSFADLIRINIVVRQTNDLAAREKVRYPGSHQVAFSVFVDIVQMIPRCFHIDFLSCMHGLFKKLPGVSSVLVHYKFSGMWTEQYAK